MDGTAIDAVTLAGSVAAPDFSLWALFMRADWVVKAVMIMLLMASLWSWAIIFEKVTGLKKLNKASGAFEKDFWSGKPLDDVYTQLGGKPKDPMSATFVAAMREFKRAADNGTLRGPNLSERVERVMHLTVSRELERAERYMTFLASTGSVAPFVGLFGTVWGIMNAFQSIAASKNTSLAVVAPGIAEALFATALGLLAAIPAVLAYNKLSRDIDRYAARLEGFALEFSAILARKVDEKGS